MGWAGDCCGSSGTKRLARNFAAAVELNPWLADSWNGLGWATLMQDDPEAAREAFVRGAWAAPLSSDAFTGLEQTHATLGDEESAERCRQIAASIQRHVPARYQYLTSRQLLCWALLFAGLLWHSRIAALAAAAALAVCWFAGRVAPSLEATAGDWQFIFNLLAFYIAAAGLQLRWSWLSVAWTFAMTLALFAGWAASGGNLPGTRLPLLILPANVALSVTALAAGWMKRRHGVALAMPFETSVTSAEAALRWQRKSEIFQRCWDKLTAARASADTSERYDEEITAGQGEVG